MEDTYLMAREIPIIKSGVKPDGQVKVGQKAQSSRLTRVASVVLLSTILAGCESSQLLDVSSLVSSQPGKTETAAATPNDANTKAPVKEDITTGEAVGEKNTDLQGSVTRDPAKPKPFPSLNDQPDKPGKTLNVTEKNREIRELQDLSKSHVQSREKVLESRAPAPVKAKKPDDGGILGLGWLTGGKSKTSKANKKDGLTPPEKLRLSRIRPTSPQVESTPDNFSTGSASTPDAGSGLRTTPILPSVPEKEEKVSSLPAAEKSAPRNTGAEPSKNTGNRPSAQKPRIVLFSKGSRRLTPKQQNALDEVARYRDNSGSIIYVLGFSQSDPTASNEVNIDSQDLAISRANYVADGLRKRGFPTDQVVVQIIDELVQKNQKPNPAMRRVEVYFENTQEVQKPVTSQPKRTVKKSPLDFLKGKPFEYSESEN